MTAKRAGKTVKASVSLARADLATLNREASHSHDGTLSAAFAEAARWLRQREARCRVIGLLAGRITDACCGGRNRRRTARWPREGTPQRQGEKGRVIGLTFNTGALIALGRRRQYEEGLRASLARGQRIVAPADVVVYSSDVEDLASGAPSGCESARRPELGALAHASRRLRTARDTAVCSMSASVAGAHSSSHPAKTASPWTFGRSCRPREVIRRRGRLSPARP